MPLIWLTSRHTNPLYVVVQVRPLTRLEMRPVCGGTITSRRINPLSLNVQVRLSPAW